MERLLRDLNPEQETAVRTLRGPLLILAGAGSGKTRVITVRIAALVRMGTLPGHILAVTFTNKASREMAERLSGILGQEIASAVTASTFHKLGVHILREFGRHIGLPSEFTILDSDDQLGIVRDCMRQEKVSLERYEPRWIQNQISSLKNAGIAPGERELRMTDVVGSLVERVYVQYANALTRMSAVDFDDLLLKPLRLIRTVPEVLETLRERYRYIHVDEFQDTNGVQMEFLRLLAEKHRNLCVVGDDDQSIYGWRGARIENVLGFDQEFPEAKVIKLTQNYRSTKAILEAANAVIQHNEVRREKELWTASAYGEPVSCRRVETPEAEAELIANEIERIQLEKGKSPEDFGVLFRANSQARALEQALRAASIPYRVVGGMTFFDRKEVKDSLSYLRLVVNPSDELALRRCFSFPSKGIGEGTIGKLLTLARTKKIPVGLAMAYAHEIPGIHRRALNSMTKMAGIFSFRDAIENGKGDAVSAFLSILEQVSFREGLREGAKKPDEARKKWENVEEVLTAFRRFSDKRKGKSTGTDFLQELSLVQQDDNDKEDKNKVVLMSLHASKGLEFPVVFLPGIEERFLPHWRSLESGDVAEERRLFYVGITRAREELHLTGCRVRRLYNKTSQCKASRFLEELPETVQRSMNAKVGLSEEDAHKAAMDQLAALFATPDEPEAK